MNQRHVRGEDGEIGLRFSLTISPEIGLTIRYLVNEGVNEALINEDRLLVYSILGGGGGLEHLDEEVMCKHGLTRDHAWAIAHAIEDLAPINDGLLVAFNP